MAFQALSKNYLDLMALLFQYLPSLSVFPVIFSLNLNKILLILSLGKSIILSVASKAANLYSITINYTS